MPRTGTDSVWSAVHRPKEFCCRRCCPDFHFRYSCHHRIPDRRFHPNRSHCFRFPGFSGSDSEGCPIHSAGNLCLQMYWLYPARSTAHFPVAAHPAAVLPRSVSDLPVFLPVPAPLLPAVPLPVVPGFPNRRS